MDKNEAKKIISILLQADGGCAYCSHSLAEYFIEEFPQFKEMAIKMWKEEYRYSSLEFNDEEK